MNQRVSETPAHLLRSDDKPEVLEQRIKSFFNDTMKTCEFYHRMGKLRSVDAIADKDTVFQRTVKALAPNLVSIVGPPGIGKTTLARRLQQHLHYGYIDCKNFFKARSLQTDEKKVVELIKFLEVVSCRSFVLDGFPENSKQAKIFFETYTTPLKLIYLDAEKDIVHQRISQALFDNSSGETLKKREFDQFLEDKDELYQYISKRDYMFRVEGSKTKCQVFYECRDILSPTVHFVNREENKELSSTFLKKLEKKGYLHLNLTRVIEEAVKRGVGIGQQLAQDKSPKLIFELLRSILYAEPHQTQKFLISNIPNDVKFLEDFPKEVCPFKLLLHFTKNEATSVEAQDENFSKEWTDVIGTYYSKNQLVGVGVNDVGIVDFHSERKNRYGFVMGLAGTGKTTIAKVLGATNVRLLTFNKYKEEVIKRLSTDETPLDDATPAQIFGQLNVDFKQGRDDEYFLLDGFPLDDANLDLLIKTCGDPLYVLRLTITPDNFTKRYMKNNGDIAELSEEDKENINKQFSTFELLSNKVFELTKENSNLTIFDVDANLPLNNVIESVKSIFKKRILVTRIASESVDATQLRNVMAWLCAKFDYQFIDMQEVIAEAKKANPYGIEDLKGLFEIIKFRVNSNKRMLRNVLIFNYVRSDLQGERQFYPSSKDEIFYLENYLGKVRGYFNFLDSFEAVYKDRPVIKKVEKPVIVRSDSKEDTGNKDLQDPEDEETKKKFKPEEHDWFDVDLPADTFTQFFCQMHECSNIYPVDLNRHFKGIHAEMEDGADKYYKMDYQMSSEEDVNEQLIR